MYSSIGKQLAQDRFDRRADIVALALVSAFVLFTFCGGWAVLFSFLHR